MCLGSFAPFYLTTHYEEMDQTYSYFYRRNNHSIMNNLKSEWIIPLFPDFLSAAYQPILTHQVCSYKFQKSEGVEKSHPLSHSDWSGCKGELLCMLKVCLVEIYHNNVDELPNFCMMSS